MAEYKFKMVAEWGPGFGDEDMLTSYRKKDNDQSAREYAIYMIEKIDKEKATPTRVRVSISKTSALKRNTISVGLVTSSEYRGGKRVFRFISSKRQMKGDYEARLLNHDGSFKD